MNLKYVLENVDNKILKTILMIELHFYTLYFNTIYDKFISIDMIILYITYFLLLTLIITSIKINKWFKFYYINQVKLINIFLGYYKIFLYDFALEII